MKKELAQNIMTRHAYVATKTDKQIIRYIISPVDVEKSIVGRDLWNR